MFRLTRNICALAVIFSLTAPSLQAHRAPEWYEMCCLLPALPFILAYEKITSSWKGSRKDTVFIKGVRCKVYRQNAVYHKDKNGERRLLLGNLVDKTAFPVAGRYIVFRPGLIILHQNGEIRRGTLDADTEYPAGKKTALLAGGTVVYFHETGTLAEGTILRNLKVPAGEKELLIKAGARKAHYGVRNLSVPQELQFGDITLHKNGSLKAGYLAEGAAINSRQGDIALKGGEAVVLDEAGKLQTLYVDPDETVEIPWKGKSLALGGSIYFHKEGTLKSGTLRQPFKTPVGGRDMTIHPLKASYGNYVEFYADGTLKRAPLEEKKGRSFLIGGLEVPLCREIRCYPDGGIRDSRVFQVCRLQLGKPSERKSAWFCPGEAGFHRDGSVRYGLVKKDETVSINGKTVRLGWGPERGVAACFYENGGVMSLDVEDRPGMGDINRQYIYRGKPLMKRQLRSLGIQVMFQDYEKGIIEAFLRDQERRDWQYTLSPQDIYIPSNARFVWMRYSDIKTRKIEFLLFDEDTVITVRKEKIPCRAYQWVPVK